MTLREKVLIGLVALVVCVVVLKAWQGEREGRIRLAAVVDAQKTVIQQASDERAQHEKADATRDAQTSAAIATMQQTVATLKTSQQIAAWAPQQVQVPVPFQVTIPPATKDNPAPDAQAMIPQADLPAIRDAIEGCKECKIKLATAQQDLASRDAEAKLADQQIQALKTERDAAVKTAKGGGVLSRVKRGIKWFAWGAAAGAVALCGTGHCK